MKYKPKQNIRYLVCQGLSPRVHGNDQDSNFQQLFRCRAEDELVFFEWLNRKNQNFTSLETQNEILKEMSLSILSMLLSLLKTLTFIILCQMKHRIYQIISRPFFKFVGQIKTFFYLRIFQDCMQCRNPCYKYSIFY